MDISTLTRITKVFSFPIIIYTVFVLARFKGFQPVMEGELGDFITALNFLFGSFVAYFLYVLNPSVLDPKIKSVNMSNQLWWWLISLLMIVLALDELFMLHEQIGANLGVKDTLVFLAYGAMLGILLLFRLKDTFTKDTFVFLLAFAIMSVGSQLADYLYNEGTIILFGRDISYEQLLESFGALSLSCAITTIALRELKSVIAPPPS